MFKNLSFTKNLVQQFIVQCPCILGYPVICRTSNWSRNVHSLVWFRPVQTNYREQRTNPSVGSVQACIDQKKKKTLHYNYAQHIKMCIQILRQRYEYISDISNNLNSLPSFFEFNASVASGYRYSGRFDSHFWMIVNLKTTLWFLQWPGIRKPAQHRPEIHHTGCPQIINAFNQSNALQIINFGILI